MFDKTHSSFLLVDVAILLPNQILFVTTKTKSFVLALKVPQQYPPFTARKYIQTIQLSILENYVAGNPEQLHLIPGEAAIMNLGQNGLLLVQHLWCKSVDFVHGSPHISSTKATTVSTKRLQEDKQCPFGDVKAIWGPAEQICRLKREREWSFASIPRQGLEPLSRLVRKSTNIAEISPLVKASHLSIPIINFHTEALFILRHSEKTANTSDSLHFMALSYWPMNTANKDYM